MPSRLNQLMARELKAKLRDVETCFFVDFTGVTGRKVAALRDEIRAACGGETALAIVKASLARRAMAELDRLSAALSETPECLDGPTAVVYGADDPVMLARTLADWSQKEQVLRLKGGVLAGRPLAAEAVAELARIPPLPVLMAQVVGAIAAPLSSLLGVTQGVIRAALSVVDALAKKASGSPAEAGEAGAGSD